jgi:hypothetical protein
MKFNLPRFQYYWYESQNPDVAKQNLNFLAHWLKFGRYEGRSIIIPFWYRKILRRKKELAIEMLELNLLAGGDLNQIIDVLNDNSESSNLKIYRFHNYNNQIIKFLIYRQILLYSDLSLRLCQTKNNKWGHKFNIYTSVMALLGGEVVYKLRDHNVRKLKVDEDVLIALILDNPKIEIKKNRGDPSPRLAKLLEWHTLFHKSLQDSE